MRKLIAIMTFILLSSQCYAVTYTTTFSANITMGSVLTVSLGSSSSINFSSITDYANGKTISPFVTITVKSNMLWTVTVMANNSVFNIGGTPTTMPCSILSVRRNSSGNPFTAISSTTSYDFLNGGTRTGATSPYTSSFGVDLNVNPGFNYDGGSYDIGLVYTITGS